MKNEIDDERQTTLMIKIAKSIMLIAMVLSIISALIGMVHDFYNRSSQPDETTEGSCISSEFDTYSSECIRRPQHMSDMLAESGDVEFNISEVADETVSDEDIVVEDTTKYEETSEISELNEPITGYIQLTDDEIYELATLIWLEGYAESVECQRAICSVVINRMTLWNMTLKEVVYYPGQFTPAYMIPDTKPDELQIEVVKYVIQNGPTIPEYVCYFRSKKFHSWSGMNDYQVMGKTFFSYSDIDYSLYMQLRGSDK